MIISSLVETSGWGTPPVPGGGKMVDEEVVEGLVCQMVESSSASLAIKGAIPCEHLVHFSFQEGHRFQKIIPPGLKLEIGRKLAEWNFLTPLFLHTTHFDAILSLWTAITWKRRTVTPNHIHNRNPECVKTPRVLAPKKFPLKLFGYGALFQKTHFFHHFQCNNGKKVSNQCALRAAFFAWRAPILSWPRIMCSQVRMLEFLEPSREIP